MERLIKAFQNSLRAFRRLARSETAFQQELVLLVLSLPVGWFLSTKLARLRAAGRFVLFLMIVEVLNTGIEAACDALSREFHSEIQLAKDCGSLAVLVAILMVLGVWALALAERLGAIT